MAYFSGARLRRILFAAVTMTGLTGLDMAFAGSPSEPLQATWDELKGNVFADRAIADAGNLMTMDAPKRAEDAAIVPIDLHFKPDGEANAIKSVTLIIDENPSPVAAVFKFGPGAAISHLSTRIRVNAYSYVRAIAETQDGKLHMTQAFVKASGGCSAPAVGDQDEAMASLGKMKLKVFSVTEQKAAPMTKAAEVQLMIRHPNNSGLQMDQITRYYVPARFVHEMTISQGDRLILSMEGGISISEDPNFRFAFDAVSDKEIDVAISDTDGKKFTGKWPLAAASN